MVILIFLLTFLFGAATGSLLLFFVLNYSLGWATKKVEKKTLQMASEAASKTLTVTSKLSMSSRDRHHANTGFDFKLKPSNSTNGGSQVGLQLRAKDDIHIPIGGGSLKLGHTDSGLFRSQIVAGLDLHEIEARRLVKPNKLKHVESSPSDLSPRNADLLSDASAEAKKKLHYSYNPASSSLSNSSPANPISSPQSARVSKSSKSSINEKSSDDLFNMEPRAVSRRSLIIPSTSSKAAQILGSEAFTSNIAGDLHVGSPRSRPNPEEPLTDVVVTASPDLAKLTSPQTDRKSKGHQKSNSSGTKKSPSSGNLLEPTPKDAKSEKANLRSGSTSNPISPRIPTIPEDSNSDNSSTKGSNVTDESSKTSELPEASSSTSNKAMTQMTRANSKIPNKNSQTFPASASSEKTDPSNPLSPRVSPASDVIGPGSVIPPDEPSTPATERFTLPEKDTYSSRKNLPNPQAVPVRLLKRETFIRDARETAMLGAQKRKVIIEVVEEFGLLEHNYIQTTSLFVRVHVNDQRFKTSSANRPPGTRARWNEQFVARVDNPQIEKITFEVWTRERWSLGNTHVHLNDLLKDGQKDVWLPMRGVADNGKVKVDAVGELHIILTMIDWEAPIGLSKSRGTSHHHKSGKSSDKGSQSNSSKLKKAKKEKSESSDSSDESEESSPMDSSTLSPRISADLSGSTHTESLGPTAFDSLTSSVSTSPPGERKSMPPTSSTSSPSTASLNVPLSSDKNKKRTVRASSDSASMVPTQGIGSVAVPIIGSTNKATKDSFNLLNALAHVESCNQFSSIPTFDSKGTLFMVGYQGWVNIKGSYKQAKWHSRWCVIDGNQIRIYEDMYSQAPLAVLPLYEARVKRGATNRHRMTVSLSKKSGAMWDSFGLKPLPIPNVPESNSISVWYNQIYRAHKLSNDYVRNPPFLNAEGTEYVFPSQGESSSSPKKITSPKLRREESIDNKSEQTETDSSSTDYYSETEEIEDTPSESSTTASTSTGTATLLTSSKRSSTSSLSSGEQVTSSASKKNVAVPPTISEKSSNKRAPAINDNNNIPTVLTNNSVAPEDGQANLLLNTTTSHHQTTNQAVLEPGKPNPSTGLKDDIIYAADGLMNTIMSKEDEMLEYIRKEQDEERRAFVLSNLTPLRRIPENVEAYDAGFLNLILWRLFRDMQTSELFANAVFEKIRAKLETVKLPPFLGNLRVLDIDWGSDFIRAERIKVVATEIADEVIAEMDVSYSGGLSVGIGLEVYINWPRPKSAVLPVTAAVKLVSLRGKMHLHFSSELNTKNSLCFVVPPTVDFDVSIDIGKGEGRRVSSIPKLKQFLFSFARQAAFTALVHPSRIRWFWPIPGRKVDVEIETPDDQASARKPSRSNPSVQVRDSSDVVACKYVTLEFFTSVLNQYRYEQIDQLFAHDVIVYGSTILDVALRGRDAVLSWIVQLRSSFPDVRFFVDELNAAKTNISIQWTARGTFKSDYLDYPATNEEMLLRGSFNFKVREGNQFITEMSIFWNLGSIYGLV